MITKRSIKNASLRVILVFIIIGLIPIIISFITKGYVSSNLWLELPILGGGAIVCIIIFAWLLGRNDKKATK